MSLDATEHQHISLRVAIVGIQRERVAKVVSILHSLPPIPDFTDEPLERKIDVEYIPCVATFDTYEDENGTLVRYLLKLEHYYCEPSSLCAINNTTSSDNVTQNHHESYLSYHGQSLAPFLDEPSGIQENGNTTRVRGIAAFALGCGLEQDEDIDAVMQFLNMLSGHRLLHGEGKEETNKSGTESSFLIPCLVIAPNKEYSSMMEENLAYRQLSPEEKEEATELQTIGPGKMAKFVREAVVQILPRTKKKEKAFATVNDTSTKETTTFDPLTKLTDYDTRLVRYACKICRTILFSEKELQNPSHNRNQHKFSLRKIKSGANVSSHRCESVFLAEGVEWMGDIISSSEGKFSCPKCHNKLGLYKWHGNQCSCGTWVAPAIQMHLSKVDVLSPNLDESVKEVISPLTGLHVAGRHE